MTITPVCGYSLNFYHKLRSTQLFLYVVGLHIHFSVLVHKASSMKTKYIGIEEPSKCPDLNPAEQLRMNWSTTILQAYLANISTWPPGSYGWMSTNHYIQCLPRRVEINTTIKSAKYGMGCSKSACECVDTVYTYLWPLSVSSEIRVTSC